MSDVEDLDAWRGLLLWNRIIDLRLERDDEGDEFWVLELETGHEVYLVGGEVVCCHPDAPN